MPKLFCEDLGPAVVEWDGTSIGQQFGDAVLKGELTNAEVKENQHGNAPIDKVNTGIVASLDVPITRCTMAQLNAVFPNATLAGNVLTFNNPVGGNQFDDAKTLIIKPQTDQVASAAPAEWITVFETYPIHIFELQFGTENQRVFNITFNVFPSATSPNIGKMFKFGE